MQDNIHEEEHISQEEGAPEVRVIEDEGSEHDSGFDMPEVAEETDQRNAQN